MISAGGLTNMTQNNAYIARSSSLCTFKLPSAADVGSVTKIVGRGPGFFVITQDAGQYIEFDNFVTQTGTGGQVASTDATDNIELVCVEASTGFVVVSSIGSFILSE